MALDALRRQISDTVTTLGAGVDGSVLRIDTAYNNQGLAYLLASYADTAGTQIVNQVENVYPGAAAHTRLGGGTGFRGVEFCEYLGRCASPLNINGANTYRPVKGNLVEGPGVRCARRNNRRAGGGGFGIQWEARALYPRLNGDAEMRSGGGGGYICYFHCPAKHPRPRRVAR